MLASTVRKIRNDFDRDGFPATVLAARHNVKVKTARNIIRLVVSDDPGLMPEECRLGIYAGFGDVIDPILREHRVSWAHFMGSTRLARVVACRHQAWGVLHSMGKPYIRIAQFCGRDHTTIMHGVRKWRRNHIAYGTNEHYFGA